MGKSFLGLRRCRETVAASPPGQSLSRQRDRAALSVAGGRGRAVALPCPPPGPGSLRACGLSAGRP